MLEAQLQDKAVALLKRYGCVGFKAHQGAYATPGIFDWIGCAPDGRFMAVEFKKPDAYKDVLGNPHPVKGLTPAQRRWYDKWRVIPNALIWVIDDLAKLERLLDVEMRKHDRNDNNGGRKNEPP